jgi:hypothetical protein
MKSHSLFTHLTRYHTYYRDAEEPEGSSPQKDGDEMVIMRKISGVMEGLEMEEMVV